MLSNYFKNKPMITSKKQCKPDKKSEPGKWRRSLGRYFAFTKPKGLIMLFSRNLKLAPGHKNIALRQVE